MAGNVTGRGRSLPRMVAVLAAACALSGCATITVPRPTSPEASAPPVPGAVAADRDLGPADPAEPIRFSLDLRMPGAAALDALTARIADPASPDYHRFLSADEIGRRYGLPTAAIDDVARRLDGAGITVVSRYRQRTSLLVEGSAAAVEHLFGVTIRDHIGLDGRRYHVPDRQPAIPGALASSVTGVRGLSDRLRPTPATPANAVTHPRPTAFPAAPAPNPAGIPERGLKPADVLAAYDIAALRDAGIDGSGQTIAVVSFDTFRDADVRAFDTAFGISAPLPERIPVGAAVKAGEGAIEVDLDVEVIQAIAPKAKILNFEASQDTPFSAIIDAIISDGRASVASISWGACENRSIGNEISSEEPSFRRAAQARGITIFVASGDNGAYCSRRENIANAAVNVSWPATSPSVVSVGGTLLSVRTDRTYLGEAGWEDPLSGGGTGGGVSLFNQRPAWQTGAGVDNAGSNGMRQVPDVAGPADPDSGFVIFTTDSSDPKPSATIVGGTSAASPFWAATTILAAQLAARNGHSGGFGFLAPTLYKLAASTPTAFHDVTRGGNLRNRATAGWDFATGLGSPDAAVLARALAAQAGP